MTPDQIKAKASMEKFFQLCFTTYGFDEVQVKSILKNNGHTKFNPALVAEYKLLMAKEKQAQDNFALMEKNVSDRQKLDVVCPVPNCKGLKMYPPRVTAFPEWECTVGGKTHFVAWQTASLRAAIEGYEGEARIQAMKNWMEDWCNGLLQKEETKPE